MSRKTEKQAMLKILLLFMNNQEVAQAEIRKKTNLAYPTIIKHLKRFEKAGIIKLTRTAPSSKGGKEKNYFQITLPGLLTALNQAGDLTKPNNYKALCDTIYRFPSLCLFFKKFPLFVEAGLKDEMLKLFIQNIRQWLLRFSELTKVYKSTVPADQHYKQLLAAAVLDLQESLDGGMLLSPLTPLARSDIREKVKELYYRDEELLAYVKGKFAKILEDKSLMLATIKWFNES